MRSAFCRAIQYYFTEINLSRNEASTDDYSAWCLIAPRIILYSDMCPTFNIQQRPKDNYWFKQFANKSNPIRISLRHHPINYYRTVICRKYIVQQMNMKQLTRETDREIIYLKPFTQKPGSLLLTTLAFAEEIRFEIRPLESVRID